MSLPFYTKLFGIVVPLAAMASLELSARAMRSAFPQREYYELKGEKLRFRSATLNGTNYPWFIEFLVTSERLGFRCYFPAFNFVMKFSDIRVIGRKRALIGSLVKLKTPQGEIMFSDSLAKEIDQISNGKLGYSDT